LETLQITSKLENQTFDSLSDLLVQHDKTFGKKKNSGEDILFTNSRKGESSRGRGTYNESQEEEAHTMKFLKEEEDSIIQEIKSMVMVHGRSQGRGRNNQNQQYFRRSQDPPNNNNQSRKGEDMTQVKCKICLHIGHVVEECRTQNENFPKNKQIFNSKQHSKSNASTSTQYVDNQEDDFEYVLTTNQEIDFADLVATNKLMRKDYEDDWILDTGILNICAT
jgi:hypothetical protein